MKLKSILISFSIFFVACKSNTVIGTYYVKSYQCYSPQVLKLNFDSTFQYSLINKTINTPVNVTGKYNISKNKITFYPDSPTKFGTIKTAEKDENISATLNEYSLRQDAVHYLETGIFKTKKHKIDCKLKANKSQRTIFVKNDTCREINLRLIIVDGVKK